MLPRCAAKPHTPPSSNVRTAQLGHARAPPSWVHFPCEIALRFSPNPLWEASAIQLSGLMEGPCTLVGGADSSSRNLHCHQPPHRAVTFRDTGLFGTL